MSPQPGFQAHQITLGTGPRRVLALHCTLAFGRAWGGIAEELGAQITMIAPDMPSHGGSPDWDGQSDFSETVYQASLAALGAGPMDVIGHSFGAATALRMAVEHPERIRSLTLFEPVFFAVARADAPETLDGHDSKLVEMDRAMAAGDYLNAARSFNRMWATGPTWDALPDRVRNAMARAVHVVPSTRSFLYDDDRNLLADGRLAACQAPTLLMRGALSFPAMEAINRGLVARLGNAHDVVVEGAGHLAPITHPVQVAAHIAALLAQS